MATNKELFLRRKRRVRTRVSRHRGSRHRLSVFRSGKHIYAQLIDDDKGITLASASSKDKVAGVAKGTNVDAAVKVGKLIAERAVAAGVKDVIFDRGGYKYHGRVK
ncbi:MAG: 50S ribosomal protein L18, partial [Rhodospirillales bacterium]|nr:50S ribosomal protein L18 [Rhodospirillales bacterium]